MSHLARESGLYYDPDLMLKCREIGEVTDKKLLVKMNKCQFLISVDSDSKIQFWTSIYLLSLFYLFIFTLLEHFKLDCKRFDPSELSIVYLFQSYYPNHFPLYPKCTMKCTWDIELYLSKNTFSTLVIHVTLSLLALLAVVKTLENLSRNFQTLQYWHWSLSCLHSSHS